MRLAYYPPYHSKYNLIERCWGIVENHWNGSLLDTLDAVLEFARTMIWKSNHLIVSLVSATYASGVRLTKDAMEALEAQVTRLPGLEKWFVDILPAAPDGHG